MKRAFAALLSAGAAAVFLFSPLAAADGTAVDEADSVDAADDGSASGNDGVPDFNVPVHSPPQSVFIGDSIIAGYGLDGYSPSNKLTCDSFANILSRGFEKELPAEAGFRYYNEGLDGRTSSQMLELLKKGTLDEELKDADAVVVSIGGNDMLDTFFELIDPVKDGRAREAISKAVSLSRDLDEDLDLFEKNMEAIAEELSQRTEAEIIVQTLYNPLEDTSLSMLNDLSEEKIGRLNEIIRECSKDGSRYKVCDVYSAFKGKANELTNIENYDIHPNAEGHRLIAELLGDMISAETYYYHDYAAEQAYLREQERLAALKKEQEEIERARSERSKKTAAAAAAGAAVCVTAGVLLVRRGKRH